MIIIKSIACAAAVLTMGGCDALHGAKKFEEVLAKWDKLVKADPKGPIGSCPPTRVKFPGKSYSHAVMGTYLSQNGFTTYGVDARHIGTFHVDPNPILDNVLRERAFYAVAEEKLRGIIPERYTIEPVDSTNQCALRMTHLHTTTSSSLADLTAAVPTPMGKYPVSCGQVAGLAANTTEWVARVHALGLVHGGITSTSFRGTGASIDVIAGFYHATPWIDVKARKPMEEGGAHRTESMSAGLLATETAEHVVRGSRRNDMIDLGRVLFGLLGDDASTCAGRVREAIANFNAEMGSLEFSSAPNYAHWIETFRRLA